MKLVAKAMLSETDKQLQRVTSNIKHVSFVIEKNKQIVYDAFYEYFKKNVPPIDDKLKDDGLPPHWKATNGTYFLRVDVPALSTEYRKVLGEFERTMSTTSAVCVRIERIQNERLYCQYQIEKKHLYDILNQDTEQTLYHECLHNETNLQSIMKDGFNRSLADTRTGKKFFYSLYFYVSQIIFVSQVLHMARASTFQL